MPLATSSRCSTKPLGPRSPPGRGPTPTPSAPTASPRNTIPGGSATYTHDAHGSITSMPHLASITYGPFDQMASADLGGGGDAYYQYEPRANASAS
jgi:hypothetical protein